MENSKFGILVSLSQPAMETYGFVSPVLSNFNTPFSRLKPVLSVLNIPEFYFFCICSLGKNEDDAMMVETSYKISQDAGIFISGLFGYWVGRIYLVTQQVPLSF